MGGSKFNCQHIVALKNKELRPIIEDIFSVGRRIYEDIKCKKDEEDAKRDCSKYFKQAITYLVNNEKGLKTFLDSPYGLMHTTSECIQPVLKKSLESWTYSATA